jgi:hypothetical protein
MPKVELISQAADVRLIGKVGPQAGRSSCSGGGLDALLEGASYWLASAHQDDRLLNLSPDCSNLHMQ